MFIKIENGLITEVIDAAVCPSGFVPVPDSFIFVSDDVRYYNADWTAKTEQQLIESGVIFAKRTVYNIEDGSELEIDSAEIPEGYTETAKPSFLHEWGGAEWVVDLAATRQYEYWQWKAQRQNLVDGIEVDFNGVIFQGDLNSQIVLAAQIASMEDDSTEVPWTAKDNQDYPLNRSQLRTILADAAGQKNAIWNVGRPSFTSN